MRPAPARASAPHRGQAAACHGHCLLLPPSATAAVRNGRRSRMAPAYPPPGSKTPTAVHTSSARLFCFARSGAPWLAQPTAPARQQPDTTAPGRRGRRPAQHGRRPVRVPAPATVANGKPAPLRPRTVPDGNLPPACLPLGHVRLPTTAATAADRAVSNGRGCRLTRPPSATDHAPAVACYSRRPNESSRSPPCLNTSCAIQRRGTCCKATSPAQHSHHFRLVCAGITAHTGGGAAREYITQGSNGRRT